MTNAAAAPDNAAESLPAHDVAVFINCPFDGAYGESLDAILFTIVACGYEPRSAVDTDDTDESRLKRIVDALRGSHLSIHDLSRVYGDAKNVAHFNMPLELGIAMALKLAYDNKESKLAHNWTALVLEGTAYTAAVSDLNGHDLKRYSSRETLVAQVTKWLSMRLKRRKLLFTPVDVVAALGEFDALLAKLRNDNYGIEPNWNAIVDAARQVVSNQPRLRVLSLT